MSVFKGVSNQVLKSVTAAATIHTVTAGKVLYLYGCFVDGSGSYISVTDAADVEQYRLCASSMYINGKIVESRDFSRPVQIKAGWKVKAVAGSYFGNAGINGVEV